MSHEISGEVDAEAAEPVETASNLAGPAPWPRTSAPAEAAASPEIASNCSESAALDSGDKSRAVELPAFRGEVIAVQGGEALCCVELASGRRVKTRVPLAKLAPLDVKPGLRFERPAGDASARVAVPDEAPELPVPTREELLAEVERLQEEFERDLRHRRLFTRDRRAPE